MTTAALAPGRPDALVAGQEIVEPGFLPAIANPAIRVPGEVEYVIWSVTGRRVGALAGTAGRDRVVFAASSRFRVLAVVAAAPPEQVSRVYLRELPAAGYAPTGIEDHHVLDRLTTTLNGLERTNADAVLAGWLTEPPGSTEPRGSTEHDLF